MAEIVPLLKALPLFETLQTAQLEQLAGLVDVVGVLRGTTLFKKGDPSDSFYLVARGEVEIRIDEDLTVPLGEGEFFGEMGVLNSAPRNASAVASQDSVMLKIQKDEFDRMMAVDEDLAARIMGVCLDRGRVLAQGGGEEDAPGDVLVCFSPRGGAGTTSMAVNLAVRLSQMSKTRVALLDADLQFGNVHVLLESKQPGELGRLGETPPDELSDEFLAGFVEEVGESLALVRPPQRTEEADRVTPQHLVQMVGYLRRKYGRVVIDTSSQLDERNLALVDAADTVLLVAEPEIVSLTRLTHCFRLFELAGFPKSRFRVVLTKVGKGGFPPEDVERTLKCELYATIPRASEHASQSIFEGKPLVETHRDSPISIGISNLARRYLNPLQEGEDEGGEARPKQAGFSFWNFLRGKEVPSSDEG